MDAKTDWCAAASLSRARVNSAPLGLRVLEVASLATLLTPSEFAKPQFFSLSYLQAYWMLRMRKVATGGIV
jgi:hypothetical protein